VTGLFQEQIDRVISPQTLWVIAVSDSSSLSGMIVPTILHDLAQYTRIMLDHYARTCPCDPVLGNIIGILLVLSNIGL
jgi:hypothetical protein